MDTSDQLTLTRRDLLIAGASSAAATAGAQTGGTTAAPTAETPVMAPLTLEINGSQRTLHLVRRDPAT